MKKLTLTLIGIATALASFSQTKNFIDQPYIEVQATADSLVTPDQIFIKINVSEKDTKDRVALEETEVKMIKALQALGIDVEKNLQVSDMLSNYRTYLFKKKGVLKSKEYTLEVGSAATASLVFIELEKLEISNTYVERISHTQAEKIANACRSNAIEAAKEKAVSLTKPLGQTIGNAIHITDNSAATAEDLIRKMPGMRMDSSLGIVSSFSGKIDSPAIDFQKIRITARVSVNFILK